MGYDVMVFFFNINRQELKYAKKRVELKLAINIY